MSATTNPCLLDERFGSKITVLTLAGSARRQIPNKTARLANLCTVVAGMEKKQLAGMERVACLARTCM